MEKAFVSASVTERYFLIVFQFVVDCLRTVLTILIGARRGQVVYKFQQNLFVRMCEVESRRIKFFININFDMVYY